MENDLNFNRQEEETIHLRDYLHVVVKRRWVIAAVFSVVVIFGAVRTFTAVPLFKATSRIVIEKENKSLVHIGEVLGWDGWDYDYKETQYKIIESRSVAAQVVKRLDLENSEEFSPPPKDNIVANTVRSVKQSISGAKKWLVSLLKTGENPAKPADEAQKEVDSGLVSAVLSRITVAPIKDSRLVDVSMTAKDPVMAAKLANGLVSAYIDHNLTTRLDATKNAVKWLADQIESERKKVEAAEFALLKYKQENEIITDFSSDTEKITAEKLASLNQAVVTAESRRVEAETRYQQALTLENNPDMLDSIPEVLSNDIVKEIKKMEVSLYNRMSELSKKYGKNHPQMKAIASELADLKKRKATEAKRVVSSLRNEYKLAVAREETLKKALEAQKAESLEMNKKAIHFGVLQRQAESSRQMYELLIQRFKETSLTEEMKTANIRVIDRAEVPKAPFKPNKKRDLLLATVLGLFLAVGAAFLLEYLDNTIKLPDEMKTQLAIPYLGPVPAFAKAETSNGMPKDLITLYAPKSVASESFRGIRTGIVYSSADTPPQVILVTSAAAEEGKTLNAANLGITMANSGSHVLLMDCDMRRPRLHKLFDLKTETGVSGILVGAGKLKDAIFHTKVKNMDLLPSGPIPPNPSELLGSKKLGDLISLLREHYDRILIDSPPMSAVTDATVLAPQADGVALIIRANETPKQIVQGALAKLRLVKANVLGGILNGIDTTRNGYYYYYYQHQYYYGEDGSEKKKKRKKRGARRW